MFCKIGVLRNFAKFTEKQLYYQSLFFNKVASLRPKACNVIKKETLAQVFSRDFCKISKNTFFYRIPLVAASEQSTVEIFVGEICSLNNAVPHPDVF